MSSGGAAVGVGLAKQSAKPATHFLCDYSTAARPLPHVWENSVGSGHATLALRADWQDQMRRAHNELGFRSVRFHGLLDDDMGTLIEEDGKFIYSFHNADKIFDFLLSIGMKPFVELSVMPTALASGNETVYHYGANVSRPKDYNQWAELIRKIVAHWVERYGQSEVRHWFFEVWNEPNLKAYGSAKRDDYFKLYRTTAQAIKEVDSRLKVGGPATAKNAWIKEFLLFCDENGVPCDFVSTHHYPTDAFGSPDDDTEEQLSKSKRSILRDQACKAQRQAGNRPLLYTEWCSSSNPRDPLHDEAYAACVIVKTMMEANGLTDGYSWWTFSDVFEENYFPSEPFQGGFGLINIHGVPKPSFRAFEMLHALGTEMLPVTGSHPTVDLWAVRDGSSLTILATNWALPRHAIATEHVGVRVAGAPPPVQSTIRRIDRDNTNPKKRWQEMGSPRYPKATANAELQEASECVAQALPVAYDEGSLRFELDLPPCSVAAVTFDLRTA